AAGDADAELPELVGAPAPQATVGLDAALVLRAADELLEVAASGDVGGHVRLAGCSDADRPRGGLAPAVDETAGARGARRARADGDHDPVARAAGDHRRRGPIDDGAVADLAIEVLAEAQELAGGAAAARRGLPGGDGRPQGAAGDR